MKWVGLFIIIAGILPLAWCLRRYPVHAPKIWMLMGFLPFALEPFHLYVAIISWPEWPDISKGVEYSIIDSIAIAVYLSLPRAPVSLPFRISLILYLLAILLSFIPSEVPMASFFYLWQVARMFLVYAAVARACADPRVAPALLQGMAIGLIMEAGFALQQRLEGVLQARGAFDSQNFLGMLSHLVVFPFFALLLAGRRGWLPPAVLAAGLVVELLTASRATLGLAGMAYATVFVFSALRQWTSRKALIALVSVAAAAVVLPVGLSSISDRGNATLESSDSERIALIDAATSMIADHPMGIGANEYVVAANQKGYNQRSGLAWASYKALVHNAYLLVTAETGYFGLITFVAMLLAPIPVAFRCALRCRGDTRGDLMLGLGVGLLTVYLHSLVEWVFVTFQFQYMFGMELGLVAGLAQQLGYWRNVGLQRARFGTSTFSIRPSGDVGQIPRGY